MHGNELACVKALEYLINNVSIKAGIVYFVYANPEAINLKVRQINKNLNRCFLQDNQAGSLEDQRARELMTVLDKCDALLDLHTFNDSSGRPFIICETNSFDVAASIDVEIISTGWTDIESGGTDDYMFKQNKIGLCLECGPTNQLNQSMTKAVEASYRFFCVFWLY